MNGGERRNAIIQVASAPTSSQSVRKELARRPSSPRLPGQGEFRGSQ